MTMVKMARVINFSPCFKRWTSATLWLWFAFGTVALQLVKIGSAEVSFSEWSLIEQESSWQALKKVWQKQIPMWHEHSRCCANHRARRLKVGVRGKTMRQQPLITICSIFRNIQVLRHSLLGQWQDRVVKFKELTRLMSKFCRCLNPRSASKTCRMPRLKLMRH